jgi:hypothetical protein
MTDSRRAYLAGGHVYCRARREDVDIDQCVRCDRLIQVQMDSSPPYLVCDASSHGVPDDDAAYAAWWHRHHRRAR